MIDNIDLDRESPFEPGKPVPPDRFIGRKKTINKILRYAIKATKGNTQHFFLTGNRRIGKTSVAEYVKKYLESNFKMLGVYISNKGNDSVETLTSLIIESIFNELPHDSLKDKLKTWFGDNIESIEIKGNKISFKPNDELSESFKDNFHSHLQKIYEDELSESYKGIFIIIDDINGLSKSKEFVNWYKRFADTIAVSNQYKLPVYLLLAGYPEKFDNLVQAEESFGSIFHHEDISTLDNSEVKEFFVTMFDQENISISDEALEVMVDFSYGLPLMMQQIGDSIFWLVEEDSISKETAMLGVMDAANEIGNKQIRPILNQIRSDNYERILEILVKNDLTSFKKSELKKYLPNVSNNIITGFLSRMVELGILKSTGHVNSGTYEFNNPLYYIYFLIKSIEKEN